MNINTKKGFTLVEIIVVLVILAILASVTIASMLGFVEDANKKTSLAIARNFYLAVQFVVTEEYAFGKAYSEGSGLKDTYEAISTEKGPPLNDKEKSRIRKIYKMMDVPNIPQKFEAVARVEKGIVAHIRYKDLKYNAIYEWKKKDPNWKELDLKSDHPWAGEVAVGNSGGNPRENIWWNGYQ